MGRADEAGRREQAFWSALERGKRKARFDATVARHFADGLSIRLSAKTLDCTRKMVEASRFRQGIRGRAAPTEMEVEIQLEQSKERRRVDASVLQHFAANRSVGETARILECGIDVVLASRAWLGISTGRNTWRQGRTTGRLTTRAAIQALHAQ